MGVLLRQSAERREKLSRFKHKGVLQRLPRDHLYHHAPAGRRRDAAVREKGDFFDPSTFNEEVELHRVAAGTRESGSRIGLFEAPHVPGPLPMVEDLGGELSALFGE